MSGLFRPISTSATINSYTPLNSPPSQLLLWLTFTSSKLISPFYFNDHFYRKTRSNWWGQRFITVIWVMGVIVDGMLPIYTSPLNIISFYTIARGVMADLLWPIFTSTNITHMNTYAITRWIVDGIDIPMSISSITQKKFKNFVIRSSIVVTMPRGKITGIMIPIS